MADFRVEGITITDQYLTVHGVRSYGTAKRFELVKVPLTLVLDDRVFEALCQQHSDRKRLPIPVEAHLPLWE